MAHWFLPRDGVINTYVVENESKEITDFISFYHLPSTVIGHEKYSKLNAAYSFYNVSTKHDLQELYHNALIFAKKVTDTLNFICPASPLISLSPFDLRSRLMCSTLWMSWRTSPALKN